MDKEQYEKEVKEKYGIEVNQVYLDRDKRMYNGNRKVRVVGLCTKDGKATCEHYFSTGYRSFVTPTYISFKRLSNKKLFTKLDI